MCLISDGSSGMKILTQSAAKNSIFFFLCFCMQHLTGDRMTTVMNLQVFRRLNEKLDSQLKQEKVKAELTIITKMGIRIEL